MRSGAVLSRPARNAQTKLRLTVRQAPGCRDPDCLGCRAPGCPGCRAPGCALQKQELPSPGSSCIPLGLRTMLTHCCGQRDSKARRSFSHLAASSPWLSRHCQNSSRAPQHAFLSSIVGAAIPAAAPKTARPLWERSRPCPRCRRRRESPHGAAPARRPPAKVAPRKRSRPFPGGSRPAACPAPRCWHKPAGAAAVSRPQRSPDPVPVRAAVASRWQEIFGSISCLVCVSVLSFFPVSSSLV